MINPPYTQLTHRDSLSPLPFLEESINGSPMQTAPFGNPHSPSHPISTIHSSVIEGIPVPEGTILPRELLVEGIPVQTNEAIVIGVPVLSLKQKIVIAGICILVLGSALTAVLITIQASQKNL